MKNDTRMPFGKYKGRSVADLPFEYLEWLTTIDLRSRLADAVGAEYERRMHSQEVREPVDGVLVREIVGAGVRALAKKFHPDVGGDHETMIRINAAAEWIKEQTRILI